jgi:hypothetical protein
VCLNNKFGLVPSFTELGIPIFSALHPLPISSPGDNSDHKFVCKVVGLSKYSDATLSRVDDLHCDRVLMRQDLPFCTFGCRLYLCVIFTKVIVCEVRKLVESLHYNPESRQFYSRCCRWNFSLT